MKNQLIAMVLAVCMACTLLPICADSTTEIVSGTCGESLTWVLSDDGVLTISGEGATDDYAAAEDRPWNGTDYLSVG